MISKIVPKGFVNNSVNIHIRLDGEEISHFTTHPNMIILPVVGQEYSFSLDNEKYTMNVAAVTVKHANFSDEINPAVVSVHQTVTIFGTTE